MDFDPVAALKDFVRGLYPYRLDENEDIPGVRRDVRECAPVISFRHDMDGFPTASAVADAVGKDGRSAGSSTYYVEPFGSACEYRELSGLAASVEIQLHSYPRPRWSVDFHPYVDKHDAAVRSLARLLRRQKRAFAVSAGKFPAGHACHGDSNYLPFNPYLTWKIISFASLLAGFAYVSDWLVPSLASRAAVTFAAPQKMHVIRYSGRSLTVIPTSWDDRWFDIRAARRSPLTALEKTALVGRAMKDVRERMRYAFDNAIPFVVNLHPCNYGYVPGFELKQEILDYAAKAGVRTAPVGSLAATGDA